MQTDPGLNLTTQRTRNRKVLDEMNRIVIVPIDRSAPARAAGGFTLIELLVAIAILAVVVGMAAPSFKSFGANTRVANQATELQAALAYARSESVKRGVRVSLCLTASTTAASPSCSAAAALSSGWLVFVDNVQIAGNVAGVVDGTDTLLRVVEPATSSAVTASVALGGGLAYSPQGLLRTFDSVAPGNIVICQSPSSRTITLNLYGQSNLAIGSC